MRFICLLLMFLNFSILTQAQTPILKWMNEISGVGFDMGKAIATDKEGNVYIAGNFEETVDFDPGPGVHKLSSKGYTDIFVASYSAKGIFRWVSQLGGIRIDKVNAISLSRDGSIYCVGSFESSADFNPDNTNYTLTSAGASDVFVTKLSNSGSFVWAKRFGDLGFENAISVACNDDMVCISGEFSDSVNFNQGGLASKAYSYGKSDVFMLVLDKFGAFKWVKSVGGKLADYGVDIAIAGDGQIICSGIFLDTVDFDPDLIGQTIIINQPPPFSIPPIADYQTFVLSLSTTGNFNWVKSIGGDFQTELKSCLLDSNNEIYLAGVFDHSVDFDPGTASYNLTASSSSNGFLLHLDNLGQFVWVKQLLGTGTATPLDISIDTSFAIYLAGHFSKTVDFDPGSPNFSMTVNSFDINTFILKLDQGGNFQWALQFEGDANGASGISVDPYLNVFTTGGWAEKVDFDPSTAVNDSRISKGLWDVFIHKIKQCNAEILINDQVTACDSFKSNNKTYSLSGVYVDTFKSDVSCDTIQTLALTIEHVVADYNLSAVTCKSNNDGKIMVNSNASFFKLEPGLLQNSNGIFEALTPGYYTVTATTSSGCNQSKQIYLPQLNCCDQFYIPNVFTPNNDGLNDEFSVLHTFGIDLDVFRIYNRWGELVFETTQLFDRWNGSYKGEPVPSGSYYYLMKYKCQSNKETMIKSGDLTLIR